jgi:hypothetical protein
MIIGMKSLHPIVSTAHNERRDWKLFSPLTIVNLVIFDAKYSNENSRVFF